MISRAPNSDAHKKQYALLPTIDYSLHDQTLSCLNDVKEIEKFPLSKWLQHENFAQRIDIALSSRHPQDTAIYFVPNGDIQAKAVEVSFQTLRQWIQKTAQLILANNNHDKPVIAVLMPAIPEIYPAILGAMQVGTVFPINWMLEPQHLLHLLIESRSTHMITLGPTPGFRIWETFQSIQDQLPKDICIWTIPGIDGTHIATNDWKTQIDALPTQQNPNVAWHPGESIGAYIHSGGTTGVPKIVKITHRNMSFRHWTLQLAYKGTPGEIIFHDTPLFHVGGLLGRCLPAVASGASVLIPSLLGARDKSYITNYWKFVEIYKLTRLSGVPTTLAVLSKSPPVGVDLSSLKPYFVTGSTAMPIAVREEFERVCGVRVLNSYGMTENASSMAIDPRDGPSKEGSSGIRLPYTELRAVELDEHQKVIKQCGPKEIGMLVIRSPGLTPGYLNPEHNAKSWTQDGWFITGDLGRIDDDGYVFVTGRLKDVIIRGGHNIDPGLIEEPLVQSEDVLLVAAVGKPDAYAGELPIAYVQLTQGSKATSADLLQFLEPRISERAAIPKEIHILEKMPLTDIGKPMKVKLREMTMVREFTRLIEDIFKKLKINSPDPIEIIISPDTSRGTLIRIKLGRVDQTKQDLIHTQIHQLMGQFAYAYEMI